MTNVDNGIRAVNPEWERPEKVRHKLQKMEKNIYQQLQVSTAAVLQKAISQKYDAAFEMGKICLVISSAYSQ